MKHLKYRITKVFLVLLTFSTAMSAQDSFDFWGSTGVHPGTTFRLNSFESNTGSFNEVKDWEIGMVYGSTVSAETASNIYLLALSKRFGRHSFYTRYTPGIQKDFILYSGSEVLTVDSLEIDPLKNEIKYSEKFGFGYSVSLTQNFSAGLSLRYFGQEFSEQQLNLFISIDSVSYISPSTNIFNNNFWQADLAFRYNLSKNLSLTINSTNLIIIDEDKDKFRDGNFSLNQDKRAVVGVNYSNKHFSSLIRLSSGKSWIAGFGYRFTLNGFYLNTGLALQKIQNHGQFLSAVIPSLRLETNLFAFSVSWVKYLKNSTASVQQSEFTNNKIVSVLNNKYSHDKLFASLNIPLSFRKEQVLKIIDAEIVDYIYPVLQEKYRDTPFANILVTNISEKSVTARAYSSIDGFNDEKFYSGNTNILPGDTVKIPVFTVLSTPKDFKINRKISRANFYISTINSEMEDKFEEPVIVWGINGWDGNIANLRYFVNREFNEVNSLSRGILNANKTKLASVDARLKIFETIKILHQSFIRELQYVSDPRGSQEYVQFPMETLEVKGGDCDDLTVGFAAMLESVGIATAFIDYKNAGEINHVGLAVNTGLSPAQAPLITINDNKFTIRKNTSGNEEVWILLEMTVLDNFEKAWQIGSEKFVREAINNLGLAKGTVSIIDVN